MTAFQTISNLTRESVNLRTDGQGVNTSLVFNFYFDDDVYDESLGSGGSWLTIGGYYSPETEGRTLATIVSSAGDIFTTKPPRVSIQPEEVAAEIRDALKQAAYAKALAESEGDWEIARQNAKAWWAYQAELDQEDSQVYRRFVELVTQTLTEAGALSA